MPDTPDRVLTPATALPRGERCVVLQGADAAPEAGAVMLCTLHRAKGLEAPRVIVAGAQLMPGFAPFAAAA